MGGGAGVDPWKRAGPERPQGRERTVVSVALEPHLRARRAEGRKLLVPYVTGGLGKQWLEVVRAVIDGGADAIEIGIPFSDPIMDGRTIQEASQRALDLGATPLGVIEELATIDSPVPLVVMTYYNIVARMGHERFAAALSGGGVAAAILPDLPLDELDGWGDAATAHGVEVVLLAAPTTTDERLAAICARSQGFVYGVSLLGVTGEREELAAQAEQMGRRLKAATDKPVLLGVGISTPAQAVQAAAASDGVIVGSALVRRLLDGGGADEARSFVASLRASLDGAS
jgi:tryptophan synthase alpha chain